MSIQQGSFSLTRYRVLGRRKVLSFQDLNQDFARFRLKPFRLRPSRRELHYGWDYPTLVSASKAPHDSWDLSDCRGEDGIWLRVRVEKRKLSKQLLQLVAQGRIESEQRKRQGKALGRKQQKAILDDVREELLHQTLPTISFFDAYWQDERDQMLVFSTSKGSLAIFEELFRECFGKPLELSLVKMVPPLLGLNKQEWRGIGGEDQRLRKLEKAIPESILASEQSLAEL